MHLRATPEGRLAQRLEAGFWSPDIAVRRTDGLARSLSRSQQLRLAPLGKDSPAIPSLDTEPDDEYLPSPVARAPSVGHLGTLWGMRHSAPSSMITSPSSPSELQAEIPPHGAWRMAELASSPLSCSDVVQSCLASSRVRRSQKDVRSRRIRRPADFGASLSGNCQSRGHSYSGVVRELKGKSDPAHSDHTVVADAHLAPSSASKPATAHRSCSTPAVGTTKADDVAGSLAKARAVAALQRLFFEEMAKNGQDANDAAARALRRLSEAPSGPAAPAAQIAPAASVEVALPAPMQEDDEEAPAAIEEAPAVRGKAETSGWASMALSGLLAEDMFEEPACQDLGLDCPVATMASRPAVPRRPEAPAAGRQRPLRAPRVKVGS